MLEDTSTPVLHPFQWSLPSLFSEATERHKANSLGFAFFVFSGPFGGLLPCWNITFQRFESLRLGFGLLASRACPLLPECLCPFVNSCSGFAVCLCENIPQPGTLGRFVSQKTLLKLFQISSGRSGKRQRQPESITTVEQERAEATEFFNCTPAYSQQMLSPPGFQRIQKGNIITFIPALPLPKIKVSALNYRQPVREAFP